MSHMSHMRFEMGNRVIINAAIFLFFLVCSCGGDVHSNKSVNSSFCSESKFTTLYYFYKYTYNENIQIVPTFLGFYSTLDVCKSNLSVLQAMSLAPLFGAPSFFTDKECRVLNRRTCT